MYIYSPEVGPAFDVVQMRKLREEEQVHNRIGERSARKKCCRRKRRKSLSCRDLDQPHISRVDLCSPFDITKRIWHVNFDLMTCGLEQCVRSTNKVAWLQVAKTCKHCRIWI